MVLLPMRCRRRTYLAIYTGISCLISILISYRPFKRAMARRGAGAAFCPAHVTGFFKAEAGAGSGGRGADESGSLGAGFSIVHGVETSVSGARLGGGKGGILRVSTSGYAPGNTAVSRAVAAELAGEVSGGDGDAAVSADVHHRIGVPVGYGLGCSSAAALSLALALNEALGCGLSAEEAGRIAHRAEVRCRTGLGDVLAAYHGGFEVRVRAGAPGVGRVARAGGGGGGGRLRREPGGAVAGGGTAAVIGCFSPVSTRRFIAERLPGINGLGGVMVERLAGPRGSLEMFQDMSMEFARHIGVVTPRMAAAAAALREEGVRCGVALFGETVFALAERGSGQEKRAGRILGGLGGITIRSEIGGPARVKGEAEA